jgi:hypothetical protein
MGITSGLATAGPGEKLTGEDRLFISQIVTLVKHSMDLARSECEEQRVEIARL